MGPHVVPNSTARGRRGRRTGAPDGPSVSSVTSPEAGPNPPCCHQASRRGPAPSPARVRPPRPALFVVGCYPPGSPLFAPRDRYGATGRCVPTIASVPRALGRTESIAGQHISVHAGGPQRCQGLPNPGQFGLDHQHGATVHSSSNASRTADPEPESSPPPGRRRSESLPYRRAGPPAYRADCRQRRQMARR